MGNPRADSVLTRRYDRADLEIAVLGGSRNAAQAPGDAIPNPENGTFTLPCNSSPHTDTMLCLRDGSYLVPSEGLGLSSESRTLTVPNAPRADTGAYWCKVGNLVSTNLSEPSNVTVPSPSYHWFLNGTDTNETESILTVNPTSLDQLGTYKCQAHNSVTGLTARMDIEVEEMLSKPTVMPSETQVLENGTFTLTCNTSVSADTVLWLRNGVFLAPSDRLGLSPDNRTLTVLNFTQADAGAYQCEVRNPVSTERSEPSNVTEAYGPDSTRIDPPGPIGLTLGSSLTLTCVADSVPAPSYRWFFNGTILLQTGSSLTINLTTLDQLGTYKCQADNSVTGLTDEVEIKVLDADPNSDLSPGAIAGIVIGSLAGAALLGGLLYFLLCKTGGGPKQRPSVGGQAAPAHNQGVGDNKPTLGDENIQYSTLAFTAGDQKPPPGSQPRPESGTVYSEIRKK
ncbi:unnamed protein product [Lepidochelys olivacea]